ncbi:MAG TPA: DUF4304 domain-containing protein [Candidatus Angelobacter sp.]|nr:DUF4304 domain-containing protein [Candidatus Angelobacter sp.]
MKNPAAVSEVIKIIRPFGFSPKGTCLYKKSSDQRVVQMVFVQPGRTHLAGKFTIVLGVFLPSVYQVRRSQSPPPFPDISKCQIVSRLSIFAGGEDTWWDSGSQETARQLAPTIQAEVPRFFERWGEISAILQSWQTVEKKERLRVRISDFAIAALLHEEHRDEDARQVLERMHADLQDTQKDLSLIHEFAHRLGLSLNT